MSASPEDVGLAQQRPRRGVPWVLALAAGLAAPPAPAQSGPGPEQERRRAFESLAALADAAGDDRSRAQDELQLELRPHFLKGSGTLTYVPYTLFVSGHSARPRSFAVLVRLLRLETGPQAEARAWGALRPPPGEMPVGGVVAQGRRTQPLGESTAALRLLAREKDRPVLYDFEDRHVAEVGPGERLAPFRLQRALAVPPGDYRLLVAVAETSDVPGRERAGVLVQPLGVADFAGEELLLSSVIVADSVAPLAAPVSPEQQMRRPYAVGATDVVPSGEPFFTRGDEPSLVFQIYNAARTEEGRPNVTIEYFVRREDDGVFVPHGKLAPQAVTAKNLPKGFDTRAGHELGVVQGLPVGLPPGIYRLEITVRDRPSARSATAEVDFAILDKR